MQPAGLLCPWDFPGKNTGAGCNFHLQEIFLTQGSNPRVSCIGKRVVYHWATREAQLISLFLRYLDSLSSGLFFLFFPSTCPQLGQALGPVILKQGCHCTCPWLDPRSPGGLLCAYLCIAYFTGLRWCRTAAAVLGRGKTTWVSWCLRAHLL